MKKVEKEERRITKRHFLINLKLEGDFSQFSRVFSYRLSSVSTSIKTMADQVLQSPTNPHFFQPLLPGFHSHLTIPLKFFSDHIEGRNKKNTVELKSDACEKSWKVMMEGRKLTVGWKDFSGAHDHRVGDIIVFRHEGDMVFHVTGLGPSCCEIQYVQSSDNDSDSNEEEIIRNLPRDENLKTEPESSSDQYCFVAHVTESNMRVDTLFLPQKFVGSCAKGSNEIVLMNERLRTWTLKLRFRESSRNFYMRDGWKSFCHENRLEAGDSVAFKLESNNNTKTPLLRFSTLDSISKSVSTKDSIKEKRKRSGEISKGDRFVTLTVTPASLRKCRLYLPRNFTRANGLEDAGWKKITLLDKHGREWPVNLIRMHLGAGLREFLEAVDVNKAYESFVLELVWEDATIPPLFKFCSKVKT